MTSLTTFSPIQYTHKPKDWKMAQNSTAIPSLLADAVEKELADVIEKKNQKLLKKEKYFQMPMYNDDAYLRLLLHSPDVSQDVFQDIVERHGVNCKPELLQDIITRILQIPGHVNSMDSAAFGWKVSNDIRNTIITRIAEVANDMIPL